MRTTSRWLSGLVLALLCATPVLSQEKSDDPADVIKVPVWRRGVLQQPKSTSDETSNAEPIISAGKKSAPKSSRAKPVKNVQYEAPSGDGLEPTGPPLPKAVSKSTTLKAATDIDSDGCNATLTPSCTTPCAVGCTAPCAPSCGTSCAPSCAPPCASGIVFGGNACCTGCGNACCTCANFWQHRTGLYGEFLYLRPTGVDMAYAFQQNGVGGAGTVPNGSVGVVHPDYTPAFRVGGSYALDCYSSVVVSYTQFDSNSASTLTAPGGVGGTVQSLVLVPGSVNAGSTATTDAATYNIAFRMANIDYRRLLMGSQCFAINYSVGVAYGHLSQGFQSTASFTPPVGTIQTTTTNHYDGGGLRYGLDFQRKIGQRGFSVYGKTFADVLFGQFDSSFQQVNTTTTAVQSISNWRDDRVLPILELEVGAAWTSCSGRFRVSAGYYNSFWFNAITTPQYVQAVQTANYTNLGQTIAFDGLVVRAGFNF